MYLDDLIQGTTGFQLRDPKDYELLFKSAITSYTKAKGIINKDLTTDVNVAILLDATYNALVSEFDLMCVPAMQEKMYENYALQKLGTEVTGHSVANAGDATYVDTVTTGSLTGDTYYFILITLAATQTLTFTQMSIVCPTTLTLGAGTHGLILLKDAQTEAATIICTPATASAAGVSGIVTANVASRVRAFPISAFSAGEFGLIN